MLSIIAKRAAALASCLPAQAAAAAEEALITGAAAERRQLLGALAELLPPRCAAAHREGIFARRHLEQLPPRVLSQVRAGVGGQEGGNATSLQLRCQRMAGVVGRRPMRVCSQHSSLATDCP
jgi:hypothetical protein